MHDLNTPTDASLILAQSRAVERAALEPLPPTTRLERLREQLADEAQRVELERARFRQRARNYGAACRARAAKNASALQQRVDTAGNAQTGGRPASEQPDAVAEAPEQWRTEAPPCEGVYLTRAITDSCEYSRWWNGADWHSAFGASPREGRAMNLGTVKWLRLIEADAPQADTRPLLQWVKGCDVPEGERKTGLWHCSTHYTGTCPSEARAMQKCGFSCFYLRAAPGVRKGDKFNPALYREAK